jgi:hypothetical protein
MRKFTILILVGLWGWWGVCPVGVRAITNGVSPKVSSGETMAVVVSPTLVIEPTRLVKENITEPGSIGVNDRLENVLEKQKVGKWNGLNSARKVVRLAVARGVSANTVVLILLLPLIATLVAVLHYIFGLSGYGIFTPTMIAVTFLATGVLGGLALFALILAISIVGGLLLKRLKLHFWPSRSINLLFISLGAFGLMLVSSFFKFIDISKISIFPILFMIILAEDFTRTQLVKSKNEAKQLTLGTLILAIVGAVMMKVRWVQEMVLLYPEVVILLVVLINMVVGNYTGMRLSEISRFKKAIRSEKKILSQKK